MTALYEENARKAPAWLTAQAALERLQEQSGETFEHSQDVMHFMQSQLVKERELTIQRDNLEKQRQQLDEQISRLSQPDGSEDARLNVLAERFGGVLLSELYDDVPMKMHLISLHFMVLLAMLLLCVISTRYANN